MADLRRRVAVAAEGLHALPENPTLKAFQSAAQTLAGVGNTQEFVTLIDALCRNPQNPGAVEMLAVIAPDASSNLAPVARAEKLRRIADHYPQDLALQIQAARSYVGVGRNDLATEIARHAADANPHRADPQRLLAGLYASSGQWARAEQAALLWRQLAPDQAIGANLALAEIYLQQPKKDAAAVIRLLAPYVSPDCA